MKIFSWLGAILIIALIAATITAPGDEKFQKFINSKGGDTMHCKPIIGKSKPVKIMVAKILSFHYVSYCEMPEKPQPLRPLIRKPDGSYQVQDADTLKPLRRFTIPKITSSERYLGLFGKFWKLD